MGAIDAIAMKKVKMVKEIEEMKDVTAQGRGKNLTEEEARELLRAYNIPVTASRIAGGTKEAVAAAQALGYPVTLKILSKDILHKSDVGGVRAGICTREELEQSCAQMRRQVEVAAPGAEIQGFLVCEYAKQGLECAAGITRDSQLGTALLFGLGGVLIEILQDVSLALLPLTKDDVMEMILAIRGAKLLTGYRGNPALDVEAVACLLINLARLAQENPQIGEIDINPFFVYEQGVVAVDARMLLC